MLHYIYIISTHKSYDFYCTTYHCYYIIVNCTFIVICNAQSHSNTGWLHLDRPGCIFIIIFVNKIVYSFRLNAMRLIYVAHSYL